MTPATAGTAAFPWSRSRSDPRNAFKATSNPSREALECRLRTEWSDELEQAAIDALGTVD
jgi:hypothetical protein